MDIKGGGHILRDSQIIKEENEIDDVIDSIAPYEGASPNDFKLCITCNSCLNEDERIINARFVNEALEAGKDISVFPICIKCNFE